MSEFKLRWWDEDGVFKYEFEVPEDFEPVDDPEDIEGETPAAQVLYNVIGLLNTMQVLATLPEDMVTGFVEEGNPATDELQMMFYMTHEDDETLH